MRLRPPIKPVNGFSSKSQAGSSVTGKNVEFATAVLAWRGAGPPSFERLDTTVAVQLMTV